MYSLNQNFYSAASLVGELSTRGECFFVCVSSTNRETQPTSKISGMTSANIDYAYADLADP
ncbi:hypothetical protein T01_624 [Trichinella spiralis]|uniref:Uncharacterized protein n=1 Tax=Trichinella spiralis TaxID=6334 RepID=A0A0V1AVT2_TRISP|nr:hypothetical protein T01_624 [Trichinella spiralis]